MHVFLVYLLLLRIAQYLKPTSVEYNYNISNISVLYCAVKDFAHFVVTLKAIVTTGA